MRPALLIAGLSLMLGGCAFGTSVGNFQPAHRPEGIAVNVHTALADFEGELLEVRADALVIRTWAVTQKTGTGPRGATEQQVRLVPFSAIRRATFAQVKTVFGAVRLTDGRAPDGKLAEKLRLLSRFPYGIQPHVLAQLLKAHGQTEMAGVQPPR